MAIGRIRSTAKRLWSRLRSRRGQATLFNARKRTTSAEDFVFFKALIAAPFDLGTAPAGDPLPNALVMPANGKLGVSFSVDIDQGDLLVNIGVRPLGTPDLVADQVRELEIADRAEEVVPESAVAGDVTLYILDEWDRPSVIALGTFS